MFCFHKFFKSRIIYRSIEKLIDEDNYNIGFNLKKTKFKNKYNDKIDDLDNEDKKIEPDNNLLNWLKWSNNCCRYDAFLTLYTFIIKNNIKDVLNNCNEYIKYLDDKTNELLKEPTNELIFEEFCK